MKDKDYIVREDITNFKDNVHNSSKKILNI